MLLSGGVAEKGWPHWVGIVVDMQSVRSGSTVSSVPASMLRHNVETTLAPESHISPDGLSKELLSLSPVAQTLHEMERDYIRRVLQETDGVVGGKSGAAARLGLNRTTLQYKIKKLDVLSTNPRCA